MQQTNELPVWIISYWNKKQKILTKSVPANDAKEARDLVSKLLDCDIIIVQDLDTTKNKLEK